MSKTSKEKLSQLDGNLYQEISEIEASCWEGGTSLVHEVGHAHGRGRIDRSSPLLAKALVTNEVIE